MKIKLLTLCAIFVMIAIIGSFIFINQPTDISSQPIAEDIPQEQVDLKSSKTNPANQLSTSPQTVSAKKNAHNQSTFNKRSSISEPSWFKDVSDRDSISPAPEILAKKDKLKGIEFADLSDMNVRGTYTVAITQMYKGLTDKHQKREMVLLAELLEEAAVRQAHVRARLMGLDVEGKNNEDQSFFLIGFEGEEPVYNYTMNYSASVSTAANFVRQSTSFDNTHGSSLDGSGFFFNVNDHGIARQHLEFQSPDGSGSRIIEREIPDGDDHMDHVSGTVGAHGYREDAKGMAPSVMMYSLNQQTAADVDLLSMSYPFEPRRSIGGTTSLGYKHSTGEGGIYNSQSFNFDRATLNKPYYLHFYAAGNSRSWDTVSKGQQMSKNIITVVSGKHVNRDVDGNYISGGDISSLSSRGPADDGRIKPDLVANGEGVTSTIQADGYTSKNGTSMATPNASGSSILLQDYFSKRFPGHLMKSHSLKNLILHTADDLGDVGPDYEYGWGYMNTKKAGDLIKSYADNPANRRMTENSLTNGQTHTYSFTWDGSSPLVANLTWLDYLGFYTSENDIRTPNLAYDLDLRIISPSGSTIYLPWAMPFVLNGFDTNDWDTDAVKADNTTDNVEQVKIDSPVEAGIYTVEVTHKGTIASDEPVSYSLIISGVDVNASSPAPTISSFTPNAEIHHHTEVTINGSNFLLGANVSLQAAGLETIQGYGLRVAPTEIKVFFPLDRAASGKYKIHVSNPDGQTVSSSTTFEITAYTDLLYENFDAAGFDFATAGWTTGADTGTNDWTISNTISVSGSSSAHVPTQTSEVSSYLESPAVLIPDTNDPIKLSFEHQWDFEIELPTGAFQAHEGEDAALLMVSVDGGAFEHVDQIFSTTNATIVSGDYWDNLDSTNPLKDSAGTTYGWTDESGGWQKTNVILDAATYKNKPLRFRWYLGTQNTGSDNNEGWWIDNVSLSVKAINTPPAVTQEPATQATVGTLFNETIVFTDDDGDSLTLNAIGTPSWLLFTDNGDGTGTLSGTPSAGDIRTEVISIESNDGTETRSYLFELQIIPETGNNLPVFTTTTLDTAIVETLYDFTINASDLDGHTISYTASGLPSWLTLIDNENGTASLNGTPVYHSTGIINFDIIATDGIDSVSQNFSLQIFPYANLKFAKSGYTVDESGVSVTLTVKRTLNTIGAVSVVYTTNSVSATAGNDFVATTGTLNWSDGDTVDKTIIVPIIDDVVYNESEQFTVSLCNSVNAEIGNIDTSTVTITENDINAAPIITINIPSSSPIDIAENDTLVIDTDVSDDNIPGSYSVNWSQVSEPGTAIFSNTSATDITASFSPPGLYTIRISANDGDIEVTEDIVVNVFGTEPEIMLSANNIEILNGSTETSSSNNTDFGYAAIEGETVIHTFTINNEGGSALSINNISISGDHPDDFIITSSAPDSIAPMISATFELTFNPSASGERTAIVTINNSDSDESNYIFTVKGDSATGASSSAIKKVEYIGLASGGARTQLWNGSNWGSGYALTNFGSNPQLGFYDAPSGGTRYTRFIADFRSKGNLSAQGGVDYLPAASETVTFSAQSWQNVQGSVAYTMGSSNWANSGGTGTASPANGFTPDDGAGTEEINWIIVKPETSSAGNSDALAVGIIWHDDGDGLLEDNGNDSYVLKYALSADHLDGQPAAFAEMDTLAELNAAVANITFSPNPEILVKGNSIEITSGDREPRSEDHTDFGSAETSGGTVARTFTIKNFGSADLTISAVNITGSHIGEFSVTTSPAGTISEGNETTFNVTFDPSADGLRTATVSIVNNDGEENPFTFAVQGTGITVFSDTDADGIDDNWEMTNFGNLTTANAVTDTDKDGSSDYVEFRAGTNPTNAASFFGLNVTGMNIPMNELDIAWPSATGRTYTVLLSHDLLGNWSVLQSKIVATPPTNVFTWGMDTNDTSAFLRILLEE